MSRKEIISYIGIGSNIEPQYHIEQALKILKNYVNIKKISTFYKTEPVLRKNQNYFFNGVWEISTSIKAFDLKYSILRDIERMLLRSRQVDKHAPRTIDLDILLYGNAVVRDNFLQIPDPDIYTRPFIYVPLYELNPNLVLPCSKIPLKNLILRNKEPLIPMKIFTKQLKAIL